MSIITRRFTVTASRMRNGPTKGTDDVLLGSAVEWDGESITIELDALPVGRWWGGVALLRQVGHRGDLPINSATLRQFDVVAGKRVSSHGGDTVTKWIRVGSAADMGGYLSVDLATYPAGSWWDGKLRLFLQKPKKAKHHDA